MIELLGHLGFLGCQSSDLNGRNVFSGCQFPHLLNCRNNPLTLYLFWVSLNSHESRIHQNPCSWDTENTIWNGLARKGGRHTCWMSLCWCVYMLHCVTRLHLQNPKIQLQASDSRTLSQMQDPVWTGHMAMEPALLFTFAVLEESLLSPAKRGGLHKGLDTWREGLLRAICMPTTTSHMIFHFRLVPLSLVLSSDLRACILGTVPNGDLLRNRVLLWYTSVTPLSLVMSST